MDLVARDFVAKLDSHGKPAWIAVTVLGFLVFWPIGLAILAFLIWSGRMGCRKHGGRGRWYYSPAESAEAGEGRWWSGRRRRAETSGNRAFDEYRDETLRRLEEEQQEFQQFLERLRHAKDKAEFDQFMAERRRHPPAPEADQPA